MSLYTEYEAYVQRYKDEYGPNTVVLYRCGGFYEIYSADDGLVDMKMICDLLNIQMSRRNKSILEVSRSNTLMAGFPAHALQKFINILVTENYTVVVVDQVSDPPKPKRAVTAIVSPGTDINNIHNPETNNLMCIFFENSQDFFSKKNIMVIGLSIIDLSTGKSKVMEVSSTCRDPFIALDETYRIIKSECPREIVLTGDHPGNNAITYLELDGKCIHNVFNLQQNKSEVLNINYQKALLERVFPNHGILSVIEYLSLEKMPIATISFVYLLQFSFKHNERILEKIQKPIILTKSDTLCLSYNCVNHLNIVSTDDKVKCLLSLLNKSCTAVGKRMFREWFLNPITNTTQIEHRYDCIDDMIENENYRDVRNLLVSIYDIERLSRRICMGTIHPCELGYFYDSISVAKSLFSSKLKSGIIFTDETLSGYVGYASEILSNIHEHFDMDEMRKYNLDGLSKSFYKTGLHQDIDELQSDIDDHLSFLYSIANELNGVVGSDMFKLEYNQVDGYYLSVTEKRFKDTKNLLQKYVKSHNKFTFAYKSVCAKSSTTHKVTHECFKAATAHVDSVKVKLCFLLKQRYDDFLRTFADKYSDVIAMFASAIGEIDYYSTCAKIACDYRYYRPKITDRFNGKSFIIGSELRHPILERLCEDTEYIPNDVDIGSERTSGILLYGTNMVGKSAYMKSIGLAVIMAQAGMFVPCNDMQFYPYSSIFTRIPSGDDLYKGQSTFAVEISELRNIMKRADKNSLVIGDELASGTESVSAVSIVAAGLVQLYERDSSFVFATHLHDLPSLKKIQELEKMKVCHLSVIFDDVAKRLVFDRKLKPGQGTTLYGLEVCRALDLDPDFILLANEFRHELCKSEADIISDKKSRYNSKVYVNQCVLCDKPAMEVHHIKHQVMADKSGFIGTTHKNSKNNLVTVCEACHDMIHNGIITIDGFKLTSDGVRLEVAKSRDDDDENLKEFVRMARFNDKLSLNRIQKAVNEKFKQNLSVYKINKYIKG